jgi:hypothetical protein
MLVYVTSLYSVREDYLPTLYQYFQQLLPHIRAPLYVFTDRDIPFAMPDHVHVLMEPLDSFETYQKILGFPGTRLPCRRNAEKDTTEFMALMNTKVEMMWRALPYIPNATHIAWIDAGILKITKDAGRVKAAFQRQMDVTWPPTKIAVPGCWASPAPPSSDSICWRFCGGFLVLPTSLLAPFYRAICAMLEAWLAAGHVAWEVNIWAALEWDEPAWFAWWAADHNETMLEPPDLSD